MKRILIVVALLAFASPAMAQQMRGPLDTRTTDSERVNNPHPQESAPVRLKPIAEIQRMRLRLQEHTKTGDAKEKKCLWTRYVSR